MNNVTIKKDDRKVLLSVKDLVVKFKVRGRILTAIRGISLDIYENESIAIVGESGSGKSVFVKTFAGMLDGNGFIDNGTLIFSDEELAKTNVVKDDSVFKAIDNSYHALKDYMRFLYGAETYKKILSLKQEYRDKMSLTDEESEKYEVTLGELNYQYTEKFNYKQTLDPKHDKEEISKTSLEINELKAKIETISKEKNLLLENRKEEVKNDASYNESYNARMEELKAQYEKDIDVEITEDQDNKALVLAKEICLSVHRYGKIKSKRLTKKLLKALKDAFKMGINIDSSRQINAVFGTVVFRVKYLGETETEMKGTCIVDLAKVKFTNDWQQIRGKRVATVFQDPMSSLNPIITIGKQITSIIIKHQKCSEVEARERAIILMKKVGIPNAENRFDDYPFQYSGGMRQRIVIAIALSCQPKILICDEPTTALDVTIQAQILRLIKSLQNEFKYTIVFITHDLGVVANIADRVAVLYAGQIVEVGTVKEIFYEPKHPYTWALLSSMPQLATRNTTLYSITGTPPSLYNKIIGDPFAPRNPYCLKIDTLKDSPMFKVSDTHYAKTWLLDPRAPKKEKPSAIQNIHEKLIKAFNVYGTNEVEFDENATKYNGVIVNPKYDEFTPSPTAPHIPEKGPIDPRSGKEVLLSLRNVDITFGKGDHAVRAVKDASFDIYKGETFSLVGESGSGKTTIGRAVIRVNGCAHGEILYKGVRISGNIPHSLDREVIRNVQMIFQDPASSLNERATVDYIISEGLYNFHLFESEADRVAKVENMIKQVGLLPEHLTRYPHEFSGGQRQRIGIARAMVMNPELVVADEPISALDVSIRAQVLNLLTDFKKEQGTTYLFIAHDLSIVRFISDRIGVIYKGNIVEVADAVELFDFPLHPYTKSLISAIPIPDPELEKHKELFTYDPSIHDYSTDKPELVDIGHGHLIYGNKQEIEEYKKLREQNVPIKSITILTPEEEANKTVDKIDEKISDEFLDHPLHDTGNSWYGVLSFFLPVVGIIMAYIFKKHNYIRNYKVCKKLSIIGFCVIASIILLFFILLLLVRIR